VELPPLTQPDLTELAARVVRRDFRGRREHRFRYLLDSRLFRLLCRPGQTDALDGFQGSLARHRLAPEGGLPDLEMTPLAVLDALGIEHPQFPTLPLTKSLIELSTLDLSTVLVRTMRDEFAKNPELQTPGLRQRAEELRQKTDPAAHPLFDQCLTSFVSREDAEDRVLSQLALDALFTYRFPEEIQDEMSHFFDGILFDTKEKISGFSKVRLLKVYWTRSYDRVVRKHPEARGEIQSITREMASRRSKDFLGWEIIHHAVLGYPGKRIQPVIAFTADSEATLKARSRAYKTALRAFLDDIPREELATELRPRLNAWKPGWLVPCPDGTFDSAVSTGELPIY